METERKSPLEPSPMIPLPIEAMPAELRIIAFPLPGVPDGTYFIALGPEGAEKQGSPEHLHTYRLEPKPDLGLATPFDPASELEPEEPWRFSLVIPHEDPENLARAEVYGAWIQDFHGTPQAAKELAARTSPACVVCDYKVGYKGAGHVGFFTLAEPK